MSSGSEHLYTRSKFALFLFGCVLLCAAVLSLARGIFNSSPLFIAAHGFLLFTLWNLAKRAFAYFDACSLGSVGLGFGWKIAMSLISMSLFVSTTCVFAAWLYGRHPEYDFGTYGNVLVTGGFWLLCPFLGGAFVASSHVLSTKIHTEEEAVKRAKYYRSQNPEYGSPTIIATILTPPILLAICYLRPIDFPSFVVTFILIAMIGFGVSVVSAMPELKRVRELRQKAAKYVEDRRLYDLEKQRERDEEEQKRIAARNAALEAERVRREWEASPEGQQVIAEEQQRKRAAEAEEEKKRQAAEDAERKRIALEEAERVQRAEAERREVERQRHEEELRRQNEESARKLAAEQRARKAAEAEQQRRQEETERRLEKARQACQNLVSIAEADLSLVETQLSHLQASNNPEELIAEETVVMNARKREILQKLMDLRKSLAEMY